MPWPAILGNMQGYGQYCPLARGAEVLGDRWTLLIIREMLFGVQRFNELERFLPGISRSVLAQRLRKLHFTNQLVTAKSPSQSGEVIPSAATIDTHNEFRKHARILDSGFRTHAN